MSPCLRSRASLSRTRSEAKPVEIYYSGIGYVGSDQQDVAEALEAPEPQGTEKPRQAS